MMRLASSGPQVNHRLGLLVLHHLRFVAPCRFPLLSIEARPGHEVKLHSSDIRNIVQRQTRVSL
jgi:hypothetical protein